MFNGYDRAGSRLSPGSRWAVGHVRAYLVLVKLLYVDGLCTASGRGTRAVHQLERRFAARVGKAPMAACALRRSLTLVSTRNHFASGHTRRRVVVHGGCTTKAGVTRYVRVGGLAHSYFRQLRIVTRSCHKGGGLSPRSGKMRALLHNVTFCNGVRGRHGGSTPKHFRTSYFTAPQTTMGVCFTLLSLVSEVRANRMGSSATLLTRRGLFSINFRS